MTTPTQGEHAQPEALQDFEVRKLAAIGAVSTSSGLVERRPIEYRRELEDQFVRGFRAAEMRLAAQVAALTAAPQGGAYVENPAEIEHVAGDVSKNRSESNMKGGAYAPMQGLSAYLRAEAVGVQGVAAETLRQWAAEVDVASAHALRASHGQAPAGEVKPDGSIDRNSVTGEFELDWGAQPATAASQKPLTDEQIDKLHGEANRGYCIEFEHYVKAVRDTEAAHGIKET